MDDNKETSQEDIIVKDSDNKKDMIKEKLKGILNKVSDFIKNWKYLVWIVWWVAIATTALMIFFITKTIIDIKKLDSTSEILYNLSNYDTSPIKTNNYLKNEATDFKKINELIDYNTYLKESITRYNEYLWWVQAPYDNFLKYLLLPSLNIWKDDFLGKINDDYIWEKFLENNPYNDIELIDKRSNFIKDVGANNEYNEINSIEVWEITEKWDEFYIPINVSYTANSYRSFLLLVEKLSTTSNQKSISLINELIYNIWEIIKIDRIDEINEIQQEYTWFSQDKAIGYNLFQRVKGISDTTLITDEIIDKAIKQVAQCWNETQKYCYYKFRNKYRNIPSLAYTIWIEWDGNYTEKLRKFLQEMPQIIKIVNFTYDWEQETKDMTNYTTKQYVWNIEFRIYWDWLHEDEVLEIQKLLWEKCIWRNLTPETALEQIETSIANLWNSTSIDAYSTIRLMDLKTLITNIWTTYNYLNNYKKVIKTFEIYRMLNEWNVCNI